MPPNATSHFKKVAREKALDGRPPPLTSPRTRCPITGEPIEIKQVGTKWFAHTSLWTSRPYDFRDTLVYTLSHNGGTAPDLPRPGVTAVVPPGPSAETEEEVTPALILPG